MNFYPIKRRLIKTFFKDKFIGQVSSLGAGLLSAVIVSYLSGAPEFLTYVIDLALNILSDAGVEGYDNTVRPVVTAAELMTFLTPSISWCITAGVQEWVARDNNKVLQIQQDAGKYDGPLDNWVGPVAQAGMRETIVELDTALTELDDAGLGPR